MATATRDPTADAVAGTLRADLLYRLNVFVIHLPPLRARREDIPLLVRVCIKERAAALNIAVPPACAEETLAMLAAYAWPGNMRELRNTLERALVLCKGRTILPDHLPPGIRAAQPGALPGSGPSLEDQLAGVTLPEAGASLPDLVHILESTLVAQALARTENNQSRAAALLGLTRDQLRVRKQR